MGFIKNVVNSISSVLGPVLSLAKLIPGVGQLVGLGEAALNFVSNIDKALQNFPKGLIQVALGAAASMLPTPLSNIAKIIADPAKALEGIIPKGVLAFLPASIRPAVPKLVTDLIW